MSLFLYMTRGCVLILLIYMQLSNFLSTTCWRDCHLLIFCFCLLGKSLIDHTYVDLFLGYILLINSIPFHWSTCLFLYQYYTVLIPVALWYCLKSGRLMPLALFLFLRIALANLGLSEWLSLKSLQIISAREGVEKREFSYTVGGNVSWWCNFGKHYRGSSEN